MLDRRVALRGCSARQESNIAEATHRRATEHYDEDVEREQDAAHKVKLGVYVYIENDVRLTGST